MNLKTLKAQSHHLECTVQIGKAGITDSIRDEIKRQLHKKKLVKVKLLKSAKTDSTKTIARNLAAQLGVQLVKEVGGTFTLYKSENSPSVQTSPETPESIKETPINKDSS